MLLSDNSSSLKESESKDLQMCLTEYVEAWAFYIGVKLTQQFLTQPIILEGDCLPIIKFLNDDHSLTPWRIKSIIS